MVGKNWKRNQSKKRYRKSSRTIGPPQQSPDLRRNQIVAYDADFARRQKLIYFHACAVCRKREYCMTACSRCQLAKCCNDECLRQHRSLDEQRVICVRNVTFSEARKLIPSHEKKHIFKLGYSEISPHLYSIPRREVYQLMGGPRSVVLLQVILTLVVDAILQIFVIDIDGFTTVLNVYPPATFYFAQVIWCKQVRQTFPPSTFILLWNCCWNNHIDVQYAAVDIRDLNRITRLANTEEIFKSITQKDREAVIRMCTR